MFFLLLVVISNLQAEPNKAEIFTGFSVSKAYNQSFYRAVNHITSISGVEKKTAIKSLLLQYADFTPAYFFAYNEILQEQNSQGCIDYFSQLAQNPRCNYLSRWMLARTHFAAQNATRSLEIFLSLINEPDQLAPSQLLWEFLQICTIAGFSCETQLPSQFFDRYPIFSALQLKAKGQDEQSVAEFVAYYRIHDKTDLFALFLFIESLRLQKRADPELDGLLQYGIDIARLNEDRYSEMLFRYVAGRLYFIRKQYIESVASFEHSYALAKAMGNMVYAVRNRIYIGHVYKLSSHYNDAKIAYQAAEKLALQANDKNLLLQSLNALGKQYQIMSEYDKALKIYKRCLKYEVFGEDVKSTYYLLRGEIYLDLNQITLAKNCFGKALQIGTRIQNKYTIALANGGLGEVHLKTGNYAQAKVAFEQLIDFWHFPSQLLTKATWIHKLADVYVGEKQYEIADRYFVRAIKIAREAGDIFYSLRYLCDRAQNLTHIPDLTRAQGCLDEVLNNNIIQGISSPIRARANYLQGRIFCAQNELSRAIPAYLKAVKDFEQIRRKLSVKDLRIGFFSEAHVASKELAGCYLEKFIESAERSYLDSALYFIKLGRNRALLETKLTSNLNAENAQSYYLKAVQLSKLQRQWRLAKSEFKNSGKIDSLAAEAQLEQFALIEKRLYLFHAQIDSAKQFTFEDIHDLHKMFIPTKQGRVLYQIVDDRIYAIVTNNTEIKVVKLEASHSKIKQAIDALVLPFLNVTEQNNRQIPFNAKIANQLYIDLIQPIEANISLPEEMIIVPDGILNQLPFEMLLFNRAFKSSYIPADYPEYAEYFLQHRYSIGYSPTVFPDSTVDRPQNPNLVIFANPAYDIEQKAPLSLRRFEIFSPLLFAGKEAEKIAEAWDKTQIFIGKAATKQQFIELNGHAQIGHFATHAFTDSLFDAFSAIVLAASQDSTDDGLLMGYEIDDMDFSGFDLVFLSACHTGQGHFVPGEGVLGLPRSFVGAGARSVIMTHWSIDDRFASHLAPEFYERYLKKGYSKIHALASAKRKSYEISNGKHEKIYYEHPFYWAPFMLYGEPGNERSGWTYSRIFLFIASMLFVVAIIKLYFIKMRLIPSKV